MTVLTTPRADGYAMPAEWAPQARTWMAWPTRPDTWRAGALPARAAFSAVARLVARHQPVTVCLAASEFKAAAARLGTDIALADIPTNDAWMRDIGPGFVRHASGAVRAVDWRFNAWGGSAGGLYADWQEDDAAAGRIAAALGIPCYRAPLVLEGGAIHVDGEGSCLTTEECLLNPNRNPGLSRHEIEGLLGEYLGVRKVLWLGQGLTGDETSGHIDNLCCFIRPGVVALAWTDEPTHPDHAVCKDAADRLCAMTDACGRALTVVKLPLPREILRMTEAESAGLIARPGSRARPVGTRLVASPVNYLLVNGAVLVPTFGEDTDEPALAVLRAAFPARVIHAVPSREILLGGGHLHCITQTQPA